MSIKARIYAQENAVLVDLSFALSNAYLAYWEALGRIDPKLSKCFLQSSLLLFFIVFILLQFDLMRRSNCSHQ